MKITILFTVVVLLASSMMAAAQGYYKACTTEYDPVCGTDGKTYSNRCVAESYGVCVDYYGECKKCGHY